MPLREIAIRMKADNRRKLIGRKLAERNLMPVMRTGIVSDVDPMRIESGKSRPLASLFSFDEEIAACFSNVA